MHVRDTLTLAQLEVTYPPENKLLIPPHYIT